MIETIKQVTTVAAATLENKVYEDKILDEKSFYIITKENGLIPLIYEGLDKSNITENLLNKLTKHYLNYIAHDMQMLDGIKTLKEIFDHNKIKHIFLKGSLLKSIYPKTYFRGMGDIDILIQANDLDKVHTIFKSLNIELLLRSVQHDVFLMHKRIHIEIHPLLYKDFNKKYASIIEHPWDYAKQDNNYTYKLSHEFTIIYLLYHLAKHLDSSGIGLRSILDIGVYVNNFKNEINQDKLKGLLEQTSLLKFFSNLMYLNLAYFQLCDLDSFIYSTKLAKDDYDDIISYFSISGIHGKGNLHNPFETRIASSSNKDESRFKILFSIMFPSFNSMKQIYPILKKIPPLLPLMWFIKWIKLIFKKTKSSFKKIRLLIFKPNKKSINKIKNIYDKLGL